MKRELRVLAAASLLSLAFVAADRAFAQNAGGILHIGHFDSPASMSMLEESTQAVNRPMSGVFNNLVIFKQDEPQNTPESIVPELATSWSWRRRHRVGVPAAPRSEMARWQALHGSRCEMHSRPAAGQGHRKVAHQSAQTVVRECVGSIDERRL